RPVRQAGGADRSAAGFTAAAAAQRWQSAESRAEETTRADLRAGRRRLETKVSKHGAVPPERGRAAERFATRRPRGGSSQTANDYLLCGGAGANSYRSLSRSFNARQIQPADSVWSGPDHRVSHLFGCWRQSATCFSFLCHGVGGFLVWHFDRSAQNHSRA